MAEEEVDAKTTAIDMEVPADEQELRILIICKNLNKFKSVGQFLSKRGWPTFVVTTLGEAIQTCIKEVPHFVLISADNPNPKVLKLPPLLSQSFNTRVIAFGEDLNALTMKKLNKVKARHVWKNAVSGPSIQRSLKKMILDEQNPVDDSSSGSNKQSFSNNQESGSINIKGNSADKMKELMRFMQEDNGDGAGPGEAGGDSGGMGQVGGSGMSSSSSSSDSGGMGQVGGSGSSSATGGMGQIGGDGSSSASGGMGQVGGDSSSSSGGMGQVSGDGMGMAGGSMASGSTNEGAGAAGQSGAGYDPYKNANGPTPGEATKKSGMQIQEGTKGPGGTNGTLPTENAKSDENDPYANSNGKTASGSMMQEGQENKQNKPGLEEPDNKDKEKGEMDPYAAAAKNKSNVPTPEAKDKEKLPLWEDDKAAEAGKTPEQEAAKKKEAAKPGEGEEGEDGQFAWEKAQDTTEQEDRLKKNNKIVQTNKEDKAHSEEEKVARERENLKKLEENPEEENLEALYRAVQTAFNQSCDNKYDDMIKLEDCSEYMSLTLRSETLNGYLLVSIPQGLADESFLLDFRSTLIQQFTEKDIDFSVDVPEDVKIDPAPFIEWADSQGRFCLLNVHNNNEIGLAFFPHTEILPSSLSTHKGMVKLNIKDLSTTKNLTFNVFIHLEKNDKFYMYIKDGRRILEEQQSRMMQKEFDTVHIKRKDMSKYRKYHQEAHLIHLVEEYEELKRMSASAAA